MRIFEVNNFLNRFNTFLLESFKEDMYRVYSKDEETNDEDFDNAIKTFNNNQQVKDGIKKMIEPGGYLAGQIKKKFTSRKEFVDAVSKLLDEFNKGLEKGENKNYDGKNEIGQEYAEIQQAIKDGKKTNVSETDFWLIPCRTYEQVHSVAQKYTGNLPILSRDEIKKRYDVLVPGDAQHYDDKMTPEEFFEWAKNEDKFFMDPSWCVAKDKNWFDSYDLEVGDDEWPKCYVVISKLYPNLRFCIKTSNVHGYKIHFIEDGYIKVKIVHVDIDEIRDPWQIGGFDEKVDFGLDVMELAFGENKIDELIDYIKDKNKTVKVESKTDDLQDGNNYFSYNSYIKVINSDFTNLTDGFNMFEECPNLRYFDGKLPKLKIGDSMFYNCEKLKSFNSEMPNLITSEMMFYGNINLKNFNCKLPKLKIGLRMFEKCENLITFESDLSALKDSSYMFDDCYNLKDFSCDMQKLKDGSGMFEDCVRLRSFRGDLSSLDRGDYMFNRCRQLMSFRGDLSSLSTGVGMFKGCKLDTESVKNIAETIADGVNDAIITIGVDKMDEEKEKYIEMIKEKGWTVKIQ